MTMSISTQVKDDSESYEEVHVHHVYEQIASHFSSTRYKVSPSTSVLPSQIIASSILKPKKINPGSSSLFSPMKHEF